MSRLRGKVFAIKFIVACAKFAGLAVFFRFEIRHRLLFYRFYRPTDDQRREPSITHLVLGVD